MVIILMGVSGSGKTTVGKLLARELGWRFCDGDDYHSPANKEQMREGIPLTDADRWPWLAVIRNLIVEALAGKENTDVACSSLAQAHRDYLRHRGVRFVYLKGTPELLRERIRTRREHFFSPALLASQFDALEEPRGGLAVDAARSPADIIREIRERLHLRLVR